jgi:hypothetical protein
VGQASVPRARNIAELDANVLALLGQPSVQKPLLSWLLGALEPPLAERVEILARWNACQTPMLNGFAPYAYFYARVLLTVKLATRDMLVTQDPKNVMDAQYLCYLPFCRAFASNDRLHLRLAPFLRRDDQVLLDGRELQADLARLYEYYVALSAEQQDMLSFALGSRPVPHKGSAVYDTHERLNGRWRPGKGNQASKLNEAQRENAMRWVERMYRDVEGDAYFRGDSGTQRVTIEPAADHGQ